MFFNMGGMPGMPRGMQMPPGVFGFPGSSDDGADEDDMSGPAGSRGGMGDSEDADDDRPHGKGKEVDNTRLYKLLEVEQDAGPADIKKAFFKMAKKHHPDKGGDPEVFKDIQQAYDILGDPDKRKRYDKLGEEGLKDDSPSDPNDFFDLFRGGGGPRRGKQVRRTKDLKRPLWVTLESLYTGVTRPLPITRKVLDQENGGEAQRCPTCHGSGFQTAVVQLGPMVQRIQQPCEDCGGAGTSAKTKVQRDVVDVFVEKGAPDDHKIVFHGKSDEAAGCEPGDLIVIVKQQEHPVFMRKGADLYIERDVTLAEALTGFRIQLQHLDGRKWVVKSTPGEVLQPHNGGVALKAVDKGGMPIHGNPFQYGNLFLVFTIRFPISIQPSVAQELRRLLGAPPLLDVAEATEKPSADDEVEEFYVTDIDPLESSKRNAKPDSGEAYDDDEGPRGGMECKQQ